MPLAERGHNGVLVVVRPGNSQEGAGTYASGGPRLRDRPRLGWQTRRDTRFRRLSSCVRESAALETVVKPVNLAARTLGP